MRGVNAKKGRNGHVFALACALGLYFLSSGMGMAQGEPKAPVAGAVEEVKEGVNFERALTFDLSPEQVAHFQKRLPKAYQKLSQRKPFHVVAMGDSIVDMFAYDDDNQNWIKAYPARFLEQLARQFFYTGGLRLIKPAKGQGEKSLQHRGREITLRNLGRGGKLSIHAMQALSTYGLETPPDLVMLSFGINDAMLGLDLGVYAKAFQDVIATVRAAGGEVMLLGPTLVVGDPAEAELAKTRAYCDTLREVAEESGAFFVDLGDLTNLVKVREDAVGPAGVFANVVTDYRRFFDHTKTVDWVHPRPVLHDRLGRQIFRELIDGPTKVPWEMGKAELRMTDTKSMELKVKLKNASKEKAKTVVLPLVTVTWKPTDATPEMELAPGEERELVIHYARRDEMSGRVNPMPSHEPALRMPLMVNVGELARIEDVRATLKPVVLLWKVETLFNQEKDFLPANLFTNTSEAAVEGTWQAAWMGQDLKGEFKLEAGAQKELPLRFKLPASHDGQPFNQKTDLSVLVTIGGQVFRFDREVDLTQNFGLKEAVAMRSSLARKSPMTPALGEREKGITLKADADRETLFLTFDLRGVDLKDDPATGMSWAATVNLDARSYGKRLNRGVTDTLRINGKAADGPATVGTIPPWAFGSGYAAVFDEAQVKAVVSSGSDGARRLTISLPRSYLYLHEWALGNGNSELGINATFSFWQEPVPGVSAGGFGGEGLFELLLNRHRDDAEGCAALELTTEPTERWTVSLN